MAKIGLIGFGYQGKRLLKYLDEIFDVRWIFGRSLERSGRFTNSIEQVLNSDIEAVVVATPMATHYQIVKDALLHGKHVLSEKPLALNIRECEELKEISAGRGLTLLTEYTLTFSPGLAKASELLATVGGPRNIEMVKRQWGRFGREDVHWLLSSHLLAVLDMFVPLHELEFHKKDYFIRSNGHAESSLILFTGRVSGDIKVSINYPGKEMKIVIYGENGIIIYEPPFVRVEATGLSKSFYYNEEHNFRHVVRYFHDAIEGKPDNIERAIAVTNIISSFSRRI